MRAVAIAEVERLLEVGRRHAAALAVETVGARSVGRELGGGDVEGQPSEKVGLLGADFELASDTDEDGNEVRMTLASYGRYRYVYPMSASALSSGQASA